MRLSLATLLLSYTCAHGAPPQRPKRLSTASFPSASPPSTETISITALGGDPTGHNDSAPAFALAFAQAAAAASRLGLGAVGAGGLTIDLGGGTFLLSSPVQMYGQGWTLSGGTMLADARPGAWPAGGCLLNTSGFSQNVGLAGLTLDGAHVACGARVDGVVQFDVSGVFFLHYAVYGLHGADARGASHELMVGDCFFAEFMWGEPGFDDVAQQSGTAIWLEEQFYDSNFYDSIIRCTRVGIVNLAGANLFHGIHV